MQRRSPALLFLSGFCFCIALLASAAVYAAERKETAAYVGAKACESCHEDQYASFMANSNKARSWKSLEKMMPKLTPAEQQECFACHTTGHGKPGGFVSLEKTPDMANLSCESCHGPGSLHAETGDTSEIRRKPDVKACVTCHNAERVRNFKFKPMLYHGGH